MLHLLARMANARRILEVGTLGGYSTIELARALPADGKLVTLEIDPHHAEVARANLAHAGLAERVEVLVGPAAETLRSLDGPFDLVFIDADKPSNVAYMREAIRLSRPGTTIIVDNVIREGGVLDAESADARIRGTRALFDAIHAEPRLTATSVQTLGVKKWDGVLLAVVNG
jgi:predicted O-methyltransferase YrrM